MALWGAPWGLQATWGLPPAPGPVALCELVEGRVLVQMDDDPTNRKFRDMLCDMVFDAGLFGDVAAEVKAVFDLATTQGVHLDTIGSIVRFARQGVGDNDYRRFLQIQIELLISSARDEAEWTGTHANIITICRKFIGTGVPGKILLINMPPSSILLSVPGITIPDMDILLGFIRIALYAGVDGFALIGLTSASLWDSLSAVSVTNAGTWGSLSVPVPGASLWNSMTVF